MWTNASAPPSSGVMKPKPLVSLKNLTVPSVIWVFLLGGSPIEPPKLEAAERRIERHPQAPLTHVMRLVARRPYREAAEKAILSHLSPAAAIFFFNDTATTE